MAGQASENEYRAANEDGSQQKKVAETSEHQEKGLFARFCCIFSYRGNGGASTMLRRLLVGQSLLFTLLTAGIIFGFPSLHDVLIEKERAYASLCGEESVPCQAQRRQMSFIATVATAAISVFAIVWGYLVDEFGPRLTVCLGALTQICGLTAVALAKSFGDDLYLYGFVAIAVGGHPIFTATTNFCTYLDNQEALISYQSGAYQISAVVPLLLTTFQQFSGHSIAQVFAIYTIIPTVVFVASLLCFPDKAHETEDDSLGRGEPYRLWIIRRYKIAQQTQEKNQKSSSKGDADPEDQNGVSAPLLAPDDAAPKPPDLFDVPIGRQIRSWPFVIICLYTAAYILLLNFNVATIPNQLYAEVESRTHSSPADAQHVTTTYTAIFNVLMPLGALVGSPIIGFVLVKYGLPAGVIVQVTSALVFLLFAFPKLLPMPLKTIGFFAFGLNRPLSLGAETTFLADIFGFENYGRLYGLVQLAAALVTPLQWYLLVLVEKVWNDDFFWIYVAFAVIQVIIALSFPVYLARDILAGFFLRPKTPDAIGDHRFYT